MEDLRTFRKLWVRPFFFYGNNWISLLGGAITTASAMVLVGFWMIALFGHGGSSNPYLGIILDLCLPALFVVGLLLIPVGIVVRRSYLRATDQVPSIFPAVDFNDPVFRHGIDYVIVATLINFVIVGTASYRGVAYMDTQTFCGAACHVMAPEYTAYHVSSHSDVACVECHVAPGVPGYVHAKVNGTKQLMMVVFQNYPKPIMANNKVPAAKETCLHCHNPASNIGDKLLIKTLYGDDEKNSQTSTLALLHVGGKDAFSHLSGIHGAHMGKIEYMASDENSQTIPWVSKTNADGSTTQFVTSDPQPASLGPKRVMDCIDCHNRAAHSFDTPEDALNKDMALGSPSASLPFVHKEGLALLKANYASESVAQNAISSGLITYYRSQYPAIWNSQRAQVEQAALTLTQIYSQNVFPFMHVSWGTHPNNLGHTDYPGCFRCHDGNHNAKGGASITNDCSVCHNLLVMDDPHPKLLSDLGIAKP